MAAPAENVKGAPGGKPLSTLWELKIHPHLGVWKDFRMSLPDPKFRMSAGVSIACKDPALVVEFLRCSSSMGISDGRPAVTTIKAAIERLGAEQSIQTLEDMRTIPQLADAGMSKWFEIFRDRGQRVGKVAKMLADSLAPTLADDCHVTGCLYCIGDMLTVLHFGKQYVELAEKLPRAKILYKLEKEHSFDPTRIGLNYLKKIGIPDSVLFALDETAQTKIPARGMMRPLMAAAGEMVLAYDAEKWDKLAPGVNLPAKSPIRLLGFSEPQYQKMYESLTVLLKDPAQRLPPLPAPAP